MKKLLLIIIAGLTMVACTPRASEVSFPVMPPEMSDCKVFRIENGNGVALIAVRCPNSSTTTKVGKTSPTVVIDGTTYQKVEE